MIIDEGGGSQNGICETAVQTKKKSRWHDGRYPAVLIYKKNKTNANPWYAFIFTVLRFLSKGRTGHSRDIIRPLVKIRIQISYPTKPYNRVFQITAVDPTSWYMLRQGGSVNV